MVQIQHTNQVGSLPGIKGLFYGGAGSGKTFLATTARSCFVVATEPGLRTLQRYAIPFTYADTIPKLNDVARWIAQSYEARQYETFLFDSLSEIFEMILAKERPLAGREPRKAYGELAIQAVDLIKLYRDIPGPNIIFTAKLARDKDEISGGYLYQPRFPGKETGQNAPYLFDFVFNIYRNEDPTTKEVSHLVRTKPTNQWEAKDRSGLLAAVEYAHLQYLFDKINGVIA